MFGSSGVALRGPATWDGHPRCLLASARMWQTRTVRNQVSDRPRPRGVLPLVGPTRTAAGPQPRPLHRRFRATHVSSPPPDHANSTAPPASGAWRPGDAVGG